MTVLTSTDTITDADVAAFCRGLVAAMNNQDVALIHRSTLHGLAVQLEAGRPAGPLDRRDRDCLAAGVAAVLEARKKGTP